MLPRKKPRTSSCALQGDAELVLVDVAHQVCADPASSLTRSSKVNISALMRSADSRLSSSSEVMKRSRLAVEIVEDLGHHLVGVATAGLRQVRHELGASVCSTRSITSFATASIPACGRPRRAPCPRQDREHPCGVAPASASTAPRRWSADIHSEIVGEHLFLNVGEFLPHVAARRPRISFHDAGHAIGGQI